MALSSVKWASGITTVPSRRGDLLPRTIISLGRAGFQEIRLFVDGAQAGQFPEYDKFGLETTFRSPQIRTLGSWLLALMELYLRDPRADRYAVFQDDFITYRNLRQYLEAAPFPVQGYCNLFTFPENQKIVDTALDRRVGWFESNQQGRGAVATVFSREAATTILTSKHMIVTKPQTDPSNERSWKSVDGGIMEAFGQIGWREYVHNPSLVQHTGIESSMRNKRHPEAVSFRGEDFDALELLKEIKHPVETHGFTSRQFIGKWQVMAGSSVSCWITIGPDGTARRSHVPDQAAR